MFYAIFAIVWAVKNVAAYFMDKKTLSVINHIPVELFSRIKSTLMQSEVYI